jgi:hypothetical protein
MVDLRRTFDACGKTLVGRRRSLPKMRHLLLLQVHGRRARQTIIQDVLGAGSESKSFFSKKGI